MLRGHASTDWFEQPLANNEDPWILETEDPTAVGHRDACIGNGLIGTRIHAWGDASGYRPGSASFMSGLWGAASENPARPNGAVELPHWATLSIHDGDRELRRPEREVTGHTQSLNMRTATIRTHYRQMGMHGDLEVSREAWLARADRHIGVLSVEGTLHEGGKRVFLEENLDCLHIPGTSEANTYQENDDIILDLKSNLFGHRLVIRSRLIIEGIHPDHCAFTVATGSHVARRQIRLTGMAHGEPFRVKKVVALVSTKQERDPVEASKTFLDAATADLVALRARHEAAWADLWKGHVESDHPRLQQLCNASLYHIYCSLREDLEESHGPCGLFGNGWDGNVFWDTELWTLPAVALFRPGMARSCAAYRYNTLPGARRNADKWNETGARYGWQSGETGDECCSMEVFQEERHIVSCVAMGQWLYAVAAGDGDWLKGPGLEVFTGCAEYWAGKAQLDPADGKYHILGVCGSDEHAGIVDDNATTNWGAAWTLRKAAQLMREAGKQPPAKWEQIADGLLIPWDNEHDIPKQMRQWKDDMVIKQADTTMLIHPWHFPMEPDCIERTVDYYRAHYQDQPIMMGYAIDGILDCRLGRIDSVTTTLNLLVEYFRLPFLITTEAPTNERLPFLTGMGGLLQFVANGMAGLITDERESLRSQWACLPDSVDRICLRGIHHDGERHTVEVTRSFEGKAVCRIRNSDSN